MSEVVAIVEGQTEQTFIRNQLAGYLELHGVAIWAILPGKARRHGGVKQWNVAKEDIKRVLREGRYCTTMFDYYALPDSWPGREDAKAKPWQERAAHVETQIHADICRAMGDSFDPSQFIPYIQLHEFEALAFAGIEFLSEVTAPFASISQSRLNQQFQAVLDQAGHPEAINDGYETCPSRRILTLASAYRKPQHGPIITRRIGLDALRKRCDHFARWVARLEALGIQF